MKVVGSGSSTLAFSSVGVPLLVDGKGEQEELHPWGLTLTQLSVLHAAVPGLLNSCDAHRAGPGR